MDPTKLLIVEEFDEIYNPRPWQKKGWQQVLQLKKGQAIAINAMPGSGKTYFTGCIIDEFVRCYKHNTGKPMNVIAVGPSREICSQLIRSLNLPFRKEGDRWGLELLEPTQKQLGRRIDGFYGQVVTYQRLSTAENRNKLKKLCNNATIVLFDEMHRAGEEDGEDGMDMTIYAKYRRETFADARVKIILTGTPDRTDGKELPFIARNEDGAPVYTVRQTLSDAIAEGCIREVMFHFPEGELNKNTLQYFEDLLENRKNPKTVAPVVSTENDDVQKIIAQAVYQLISEREIEQNTAGLIICNGKDHGTKIANHMAQVHEEKPIHLVSVTDDSDKRDDIDYFRNSQDKWAWTSRKVTEGVDIRRLKVLIYIPSARTKTHLMQSIGRISRVASGIGDNIAHVYTTSDKKMLELCLNFYKEQIKGKEEQNAIDVRNTRYTKDVSFAGSRIMLMHNALKAKRHEVNALTKTIKGRLYGMSRGKMQYNDERLMKLSQIGGSVDALSLEGMQTKIEKLKVEADKYGITWPTKTYLKQIGLTQIDPQLNLSL